MKYYHHIAKIRYVKKMDSNRYHDIAMRLQMRQCEALEMLKCTLLIILLLYQQVQENIYKVRCKK